MRWHPGMRRGDRRRPEPGRGSSAPPALTDFEKETGLRGETVGKIPKPGEHERALSKLKDYQVTIAALRKRVEELEKPPKKTVKEVKGKSAAAKKPVKKTTPKKKEK